MDLGRFLIETHLRTGRPIKELARVHHVSPSWLFKLLRRYRLEGPAGLEARSRRPRNSPTRIADLWEDEIVALRKELADFGADAGAQTIHYHLAKRHRTVPSQSTIWRVLRARGFVTEQPQKRPRSSYRRFVRTAQRVLAGRRHARDAPGRSGIRGLEHDRRSFEAVRGFEGLCHGQGHRRGAHVAPIGRELGLSGLDAHGQRARVHRPAPLWSGRDLRAGAVLARHRHEALAPLPSPDLRQGREIPPDAQEVPCRPRRSRHQENSCRPNWIASPVTTTRSGPIAGTHRSRRSLHSSVPGRHVHLWRSATAS